MFTKLAAATALTFTLAGAAHAQDLSALSTAVEAAQTAGLADTITSSEGLTVFVPTNDALAAAPQDALQAVVSDPTALAGVISYYAVPGKLMAADVIAAVEAGGGEATVDTLAEVPLTISLVDGNVVITGQTGATATVTTPDVTIGNVVVHVIDGAVLPAAP